MKSIGFVGLGAMGSVMAPLPVKAGFNVTGFDPASSLDEASGVVMAANSVSYTHLTLPTKA